MQELEKMINALSTRTIQTAVDGLIVDLNDELTNKVREYTDSLENNELAEIQKFLNKLLNLLYDGKLYEMDIEPSEQVIISNLTEKERFSLKETVIYFSGRLPLEANLDILKKAYFLEDNKYVKMNLTFAILPMFDEEVELDFIKKITTNNEYNEMIRSWTMAFFKNETNPYDYKDKSEDDWTLAKTPRINRLKINDKENPKFKKAIAYRLIDLVIMYLFIENRGKSSLSTEEKEIIENANVDYECYSENKKKIINDFKKKILEYK